MSPSRSSASSHIRRRGMSTRSSLGRNPGRFRLSGPARPAIPQPAYADRAGAAADGRQKPRPADAGRGFVDHAPAGQAGSEAGSDRTNVLRLRALRALRDVELDLLVLVEG